MATASKTSKSQRSTETPSQADQMLALTNEFAGESDRAVVILAAAYLDQILQDLLTTVLLIESETQRKTLFEGPAAPFATFSSRIAVSYALRLISKDERTDLDAVRSVRNKFAHRFSDVSFESEAIKSVCKGLIHSKVSKQPSTARQCFVKAVIRLMVNIILKAEANVAPKR